MTIDREVTPVQRFEALRVLVGCHNRVHASELTKLSHVTIRRIEETCQRVNIESLESYAGMLGIACAEVEGIRHGRLRLSVRLVKLKKGDGMSLTSRNSRLLSHSGTP